LTPRNRTPLPDEASERGEPGFFGGGIDDVERVGSVEEIDGLDHQPKSALPRCALREGARGPKTTPSSYAIMPGVRISAATSASMTAGSALGAETASSMRTQNFRWAEGIVTVWFTQDVRGCGHSLVGAQSRGRALGVARWFAGGAVERSHERRPASSRRSTEPRGRRADFRAGGGRGYRSPRRRPSPSISSRRSRQRDRHRRSTRTTPSPRCRSRPGAPAR
jgi:hypothetical protein